MATRNLAIMSTDIVGSTGTTAALNREDYDRFRARYDGILRPLVAQTSGEVFKAMGDGYLAAFHSSTDAVLAGLAIQAQLRALIEALHLDQRFATRIGISSGDVTLEPGDYFGLPVILATRVQSIAEVLTTYITESVYLTMNRNEVACAELGYVSLKGLAEKVRVFRVEARAEALPREDYAVLVTDIADFTLMAETSDHHAWAEEVLGRYDSIVFARALAGGLRLRFLCDFTWWNCAFRAISGDVPLTTR